MRLDIDHSILDLVDDAPAISGDASVETNVDVRLANIASKDERRLRLLVGRVAMPHDI
jgi:hypothetical protein